MNPYSPPKEGALEKNPQDAPPKRHPLHEALAAGLMVFGAVALVYTLFPWINPIQYEMNATGDESIWVRSVIGGGVSAILLWGAFFFNQKKHAGTNQKKTS
ncbi:hypothetical protein OAF27_03390 [Verrucomicrobiales bacterium]|nr:hypothetical protein [Verrucomicrobiales bacterium]